MTPYALRATARVFVVALSLAAFSLLGCRHETPCERDARTMYQKWMIVAHDPQVLAFDVGLGWTERDAIAHEEQSAREHRDAFLEFCTAH